MPEVGKFVRPVCLRFAVEPSQGRGWSVYEGDHWVRPVQDWGAFPIKDANDVPRSLVIDRIDNQVYELATCDRVNDLRPSYVDKADVQDAEIRTEQWGPEYVVSDTDDYQQLQDEMSHNAVRPQYPDNRGADGHTASGLRTAQEFSVEAYVDGEKVTPEAEATEVSETGDITFSGSHVQGRRIQYVSISAASEFQYTGRKHDLTSKYEMGTRADRTLGEHDAQLELATDLQIWLSRGTLLLERVSQETLSAQYSAVTGPDGRSGSGILLATPLVLNNAAIPGAYGQLLWSNTLHGTYTQVGTAVSGWYCQYRNGTALPATCALPTGYRFFDVRIFDKALTADSVLIYYNNIVRSEGRGFLPS